MCRHPLVKENDSHNDQRVVKTLGKELWCVPTLTGCLSRLIAAIKFDYHNILVGIMSTIITHLVPFKG